MKTVMVDLDPQKYVNCHSYHNVLDFKSKLKAMDDIGVVMTPFGDVVTVNLVANS